MKKCLAFVRSDGSLVRCRNDAKYDLYCPTARNNKHRPGYGRQWRICCGQHLSAFVRILTRNARIKAVSVSVMV